MHCGLPSSSRLQSGVVDVPQFRQLIPTGVAASPAVESSFLETTARSTPSLAPAAAPELLKVGQPSHPAFPPAPLHRPSPGHEPRRAVGSAPLVDAGGDGRGDGWLRGEVAAVRSITGTPTDPALGRTLCLCFSVPLGCERVWPVHGHGRREALCRVVSEWRVGRWRDGHRAICVAMLLFSNCTADLLLLFLLSSWLETSKENRGASPGTLTKWTVANHRSRIAPRFTPFGQPGRYLDR